MYTVRSGAALMGWIYNGAEFIKANKAQRQAYDDFKRHELAITALGEPYTVPVLGVLGSIALGGSIAALIAPYLAELLATLTPDAAALVKSLPSWKQLLIFSNPVFLPFVLGRTAAEATAPALLEIRENILALNLGNRLFSVFR